MKSRSAVVLVVILTAALLISNFGVSKSSRNSILKSIGEIRTAVVLTNTSAPFANTSAPLVDDIPSTEDVVSITEEAVSRKEATCLVKFKDENMILCYRSNSSRLEASATVKIAEAMLETRFEGCSAAHIGVKNLISYPELRFERSCLFALEIPSGAVHKGDHYWGPENRVNGTAPVNLTIHNLSIGYAPNHCNVINALNIKNGSICSSSDSTTNSNDNTLLSQLETSFPFDLFETMPSGNRTAVIILGNLRGGERTWSSLYQHVLDLNSADMVLFHVGLVQNRSSSSMFGRAKLYSEVPHFDDWADAIDIMAHGNKGWRDRVMKVLPTNGSIVLGGAMGIQGSGGLIFTARWFLSQYIQDYRLTELYDRFVVTRADHFYNCGHDLSELNDTKIWVPTGQDWHGMSDRHVVCSSGHILKVLDIIPPLIENPESYAFESGAPRMQWHKLQNTETFLKHRWEQMNIMQFVDRFQRVMFISAVDGDVSGSHVQALTDYIPEGVYVKYRAEYSKSKSHCLNLMLANNITPPADYQRPPFGKLMQANREAVSGWACDLDDPFGLVDVRIDFQSARREKKSVVVKADQEGGDRMRLLCWGGSNHRFSWPVNMTALFGENAETSMPVKVKAFAIDRANPSIEAKLGGQNKRIK